MLVSRGGANSLDPIIESHFSGDDTLLRGLELAATSHLASSQTRNRSSQEDQRQPYRTQNAASTSGMNGISTPVAPAGEMYVRALYDYNADDRTSLSFRQGDLIQVITQLESGWWDGIINGQRGWFPSNYCAVVRNSVEGEPTERAGRDGEEADVEESEDDYEEREYAEVDSDGNVRDESAKLPIEGTADEDQEEAAFWIPQATPDGRLFYFNTLTGVSTMELPLETPTSANETGPRDRTNIFMPDQTKPPPELMAGGYERDEDTDNDNSASEIDGSVSRSFAVSLLGLSV